MKNIEEKILAGVTVDKGYIDWQLKRVLFLVNLYGEKYFKGKKILEIGSYLGGIGKMFHNLEAEITLSDGLQENIDTIKRRYPELNVIHLDAEEPTWTADVHYDIIINWGVLYHLAEPAISIKNCLEHCDQLFLETLIVDRFGMAFYDILEENKWGTDQSVKGKGSRFSEQYIEKYLDAFPEFKYKRYDSPELNSGYQPPYDYVLTGKYNHGLVGVGDNSKYMLRRFWVIDRCE